MRPSILRAVLAPDIPGTRATIGVALGLINTLSAGLAKDLASAQQSLGQRRRQQHDEILAEAVSQAESLAYVARWISTRIRPAKSGDDEPVVITGLDDGPQLPSPQRAPQLDDQAP